MGVEPCDVVALAKKALSASKQAVLLAEDYKSSGANLDESLTPRQFLLLLHCHYILISNNILLRLTFENFVQFKVYKFG